MITNGRAQMDAHKCGLVPLRTQLNYRHDNINRVVWCDRHLAPQTLVS